MYSKIKGHVFVENYFVECRPVSGQGGHRDPNAIAAQRAAQFFFQTHARRCGVVSMQKSRDGGVKIFCVFALTREK